MISVAKNESQISIRMDGAVLLYDFYNTLCPELCLGLRLVIIGEDCKTIFFRPEFHMDGYIEVSRGGNRVKVSCKDTMLALNFISLHESEITEDGFVKLVKHFDDLTK
jgi:hypothetical protein